MSIAEKRSCIDTSHELLSIGRQCELIELPRSSYYRKSSLDKESDENLALMRLVDKEYTKFSRRMGECYYRYHQSTRSVTLPIGTNGLADI